MTGVSGKFSTFIGFGFIVGFGILGLLFVQAKAVTSAADVYGQPTVAISPGVRLKFQTDKNIYQSGDHVLLALRNDSRKTIWLTQHADGCTNAWWTIEQLGDDGETWQKLALTKQTCPVVQYQSQPFKRHTVMTDQWNLDIPSPELGNLVQSAGTGTYRFVAPYIESQSAPADSAWTGALVKTTTTPAITIQ